MRHLSRVELVDLIESSPTLPLDRVRHVEACQAGSAEASELRPSRALVQDDAPAEPSPLFWDHFAAPIADPVRDERPADVSTGALRGIRAPMAWAGGAAMAVLIVMTIVWRATLHAPAPAIVATASVGSSTTGGTPTPDDADADEAWAVVRAAAIDLRGEDVRAAGIAAGPGDVDQLARELTPDERSEFARLLQEDLKRDGA